MAAAGPDVGDLIVAALQRVVAGGPAKADLALAKRLIARDISDKQAEPMLASRYTVCVLVLAIVTCRVGTRTARALVLGHASAQSPAHVCVVTIDAATGPVLRSAQQRYGCCTRQFLRTVTSLEAGVAKTNEETNAMTTAYQARVIRGAVIMNASHTRNKRQEHERNAVHTRSYFFVTGNGYTQNCECRQREY